MTEQQKNPTYPTLLAYRGISYNGTLWLKGRLIEDNNLRKAKSGDWFWTNFRNTKRRFFAQGLSKQTGTLTIEDFQTTFTTDDYGYFEIWLKGFYTTKIKNNYDCYWQFPELNYQTRTKQNVYNPTPNTKLGVITDIDDTLVHTDVRYKSKIILKALVDNAFRKQPIRGAVEFFQHLLKNTPHKERAVFYASRSPFELYDLLLQFFEINKFPKGPLLLRNISREWNFAQKNFQKEQKFLSIKKIIELCQDMRFILIGDSSEKDALIYLTLADLFPQRIARIYIREVTQNKGLNKLKKETRKYKHHKNLFFFKEYSQVERDAQLQGFIIP